MQKKLAIPTMPFGIKNIIDIFAFSEL